MLYTTTLRRALAGAALALAATAGALHAQDLNHKQADDFADWLVADGQYAKAAGLYAEAFEERSRTVYAYKAAELYFFVKNYAKAAPFYEAAAKSSDFPFATRQLARCYKRMGRFAEAMMEYGTFDATYHREDSSAVRAAVALEIEGVERAVAERERVDPTVFVDRVGGMVNGMKNEVAPALMPDGSLGFVSDFDGTMRAYSADAAGKNTWGQMRPSSLLPVIEEAGHIGGGTLVSPDRFVFSLCPTTDLMTQPGDVNCTLQEVTRRGGTWGAPKPLPGNVNVEGTSSAQPFVFEEGGKEIMIFASDREGGHGGMDLWKAERSLGSDVAKFGTPVNLGPAVNTPGHEVTPFFNPATRVLSFSSDGGVTLGGYDVRRATATDGVGKWTPATNPGTPVNSSADDYFYVEVPGTSTAYLASNRASDLTKTLMTNDDLYVVTYDSRNITVEIAILDDRTGKPVSDPTLQVSLNPDGRLVKPYLVRRSLDGYFQFTLPVDREVALSIERPYFDDAEFTVTIPATERDGYAVKPIRIARTPIADGDTEVVWREARPGQAADGPAATPAEVMTASGADDEDAGQ